MAEFIELKHIYLHWADYVVFVLVTVLSTGIGLFIGMFRKEKPLEAVSSEKEIDFGSSKLNEYLLGSRRLQVVPIALSLLGSYVSGVTILGSAAEIYNYGTQYSMIAVSIILMAFPVAFVYVPVFTTLGVHSSYEYLDKRFGRSIRTFSSVLFVMDELFFLPMVLHVPALAFYEVTGVNSFLVAFIICALCVTYTLIGGIKAVVHTDAWQVMIMLISVTVVVIIGLALAGGFHPIFEAARKGGRLNFVNVNPSMLERETLWSVLLGGFCYWTSFNSVNQTMVQRYLSLSSLKKARKAMVIFIAIVVFFVIVCCFSGLLVYYTYRECDPLAGGLIHHMDQIFPLFVMQVASKYPGIPGVFLAGVFGAALSSLSVVLHTTSLVIMEDIGRGALRLNFSPKVATIVVKSSVVILGCLAIGCVLILQKLDGILGVAYSLTALSSSINFGLFNLGMLVPWSNWKGSLIGAICGYLMTGWISIGQQIYTSKGWLVYKKLPIDVSGCRGNLTQPKIPQPTNSGDIFPLYMLSFHWINPIGVCTTVLVGTIASFATGATKLDELDIEMLSPVIHRFFSRSSFAASKTDEKGNT